MNRDAFQTLNTGSAAWPFRGRSASSDPVGCGAVGSPIIRGGGDGGGLDRLGVRSLVQVSERMKKVLFICTANVCRSRLGLGLFNALAEDRSPPVRAEITETVALGGLYTLRMIGLRRRRCLSSQHSSMSCPADKSSRVSLPSIGGFLEGLLLVLVDPSVMELRNLWSVAQLS